MIQKITLVQLMFVFISYFIHAQDKVSFNSSRLTGAVIDNPTSLQFGPDGRLYVSQQNGYILAFTVRRVGPDQYEVVATETIAEIRSIPNHNDDGSLDTSVKGRQITGILLTGSAANPIIYVSSSDPRIGGGGTGGDKNLDTNSGVISSLSWNGSVWQRQDLVLGLPRSEENHSVNGMQLDDVNQILYLAVGGHTNAGAPSNNFAFLNEYALSAALLKIDLQQIRNQFGGKYILPTLDDPTRPNTQPGGGDNYDPFGGNDGLNQAKLVAGGPVQIHSPGYRNSYDLVFTRTPGKEGRIYTIDNGANGGWGGHPDKEGITGEPPATFVTNNYVIGEPGSTGPGPNDAKVNNLDNLHLVSKPGMKPIYGGHPTPIRANPAGAGLYRFNNLTGTAIFELNPTTDWPPVPLSMANPVEGDYRNPGVNDGALFTWTESTNGMAEYTSNQFFNGAMVGDLLTTGYDGILYRIKLSEDGTSVVKVESIASGFGSIPLDVTVPGKGNLFEGTIWTANYGSDGISILEPSSSWQTEISLDGSTPVARHECGFIEVNGKFFLFGGRETTAVDVFDPVTRTWTKGGSMPFKMHHFQPVVWNGKIYVIGAYQGNYSTGNLNNSESPVPYVFIYDPVAKSWTQGPAIPRPRGAAGLIVYNNEFYLLGGIINGHQDGWVKWMDKFDPSAGQWNQLPDLPRERDHFQAAVINGKIYLAGGRKTNALGNVFGPTIGEVDVFDLSTKTWITLPASLNIPTQRAGTLSVAWNDQIFIAGGESTSQKAAHKQVQSFDPKANTWRTHPDMSLGRHGTGVLVFNGKLFTAAGSTIQGSSGVMAEMESLNLSDPCEADPNSLAIDSDGDGYSNGDETINGTNYCSAASRPTDTDKDLISDRLDSDDDNDGINDTNDPFVLDPANGMLNFLPAAYPFLNGDPGTGFFGLGFTGMMSNGKTDYLNFFDPMDPELIMGGAVGIANTPAESGDAISNDQRYAFQYGFRFQQEEFITISSVIQGPFFGGATGAGLKQQSQGFFIGNGDQDNYLKLVLYANGGKSGFRILGEENGIVFEDQIIPVPDILSAGSITLTIGIDRLLSQTFFFYQLPGQPSPTGLGNPVKLPAVFTSILSGQKALAAGIIASSGTAESFPAAWDFLDIKGVSKPVLKSTAPSQYSFLSGSNGNRFDLDLSKFFESGGSALSYQLQSLSSNSIVSKASINGSILSVELLSGKTGKISFSVRAMNEAGAVADYAFDLRVVPAPSTIALFNAGGSSFGNWSADKFFTGGKLYSNPVSIANTTDDMVYQTERYGSSFSYAIPVNDPGYMQLRLHFAEIYHGIKNKLGAGARLMDVQAEGKLILNDFDIFLAAGGSAKAIVVTIDSILVSDGTLNLSFFAVKDQAKVSGVQLSVYSENASVNRAPVAVNPGKLFYFEGAAVKLPILASDLDQDILNYSSAGLPASLSIDAATGLISGTIEAEAAVYPVTVTVSDGMGGISSVLFDLEVTDPALYALRINAGGLTQTFGEQSWRADQFFIGGNTYKKTVDIAGTDLDPVFQTERYGKFSYQIPVPGNARYKVNLMFAEKYFSAPGMRSFNILFESGAVKRSSLDVFAAAGGAFKAYQEQFYVDVTDGMMDIQFESLINNAMIGGIELTACVQPALYSLNSSVKEVTIGQPVTISVSGKLNSAEKWVLYSGSCGGTLVASSATGVFEVTPTESTTYFVRAEGSCVNAAGCSEVGISVIQAPSLTSSDNTSVTDSADPVIFPNPAGRLLQIKLPKSWGPTEVAMLNRAGTMVTLAVQSSGGQMVELDLSSMTPGMYLIRFTSAKGVFTRRVIKR